MSVIQERVAGLRALHTYSGYDTLRARRVVPFDDGEVTVQGVRYGHAVDAHPPARALYYTGRAASRLRCHVAVGGDGDATSSYADFAVCADGREVATALEVGAGEAPRELVADVTGAHLVELFVTSTCGQPCQALWLEPQFDQLPEVSPPQPFQDPLGRVEITPLPPLPPAERCVVVAASAGYEAMLDDMLGSLVANGECTDARIVVMLLGEFPEAERIVAKYRALPVTCRPLAPLSIASKAAVYSAARAVEAKRYLCLDADVLVLGSLEPLFAAIDALPPRSVLAARESNGRDCRDLGEAVAHEFVYRGQRSDIEEIVGRRDGLAGYPLVVNSGVVAASREAMLAVDASVRSMPGARKWVEEAPHLGWREQFVFNLALAQLDCGVELDSSFNLQLHTTDPSVRISAGRPVASWHGRPVRILHLNGGGRYRHAEVQGRYAAAPAALVGAGGGDGYQEFLRALRRWVGYRGLDALAWSFYSTRDGFGARVRDPATLPVLALLHYLVRANGCARVLETGTARGVSAACLASAVAHRPGGRVVTFDPFPYDGRAELWALLPSAIRACIEERVEDSRAGMTALLEAPERFDAALLDSDHTEEQLWSEFELVRQLVAAGGLILVHDARSFPEVRRTLVRIEAAGFGVTRLLANEATPSEDAGLGLAVIENRPRPGAS